MYIVFKNMEEWFESNTYLKKKFQSTYEVILTAAKENAIKMKTLAEEKTQQKVEMVISEQLLKQSLIDAFDDLLRLTNYHPTEAPNPIKEMAYIVYWLIQRKPIHLITENIVMSEKLSDIAKSRFLFINEYFGVNLLMSAAFKGKKEQEIFKNKNLKKIHDEAEKQMRYYKRFLLYYLVYRLKSPKELEAMILGCTIYPIWEVDSIIWKDTEHPESEF